LCCLATVFSSIPFVVLGAWPVAGFLGLDLVALFVAFHLNFRAARSVEEVVVTRIELLLARISPGGKRSELRFNPLWTRLDREIDDEFGLRALILVSGERRVVVGGELSPPERESFAEALSAALARVKNGR
jgi:uncharacterized membrane protein